MTLSAVTLSTLAAISLMVFATLSLFDGVYVHLVRLRLFARGESRLEHATHTGRALVFVPLLLTVFGSATGRLLWLGIVLLLADQILEVVDMALERGSRRAVGGLGSGEYLLHGALITTRSAAILFSLILRPTAAWSTTMTGFDIGLVGRVGALLLPGAVLAAVAHVVLLAYPQSTEALAVTARKVVFGRRS